MQTTAVNWYQIYLVYDVVSDALSPTTDMQNERRHDKFKSLGR